jgi:hypothetical protein
VGQEEVTIIAIRDGIMAVDSMAFQGSYRCGTTKKWRAVPDELGGGFIAGAGDLGSITDAIDRFIGGGPMGDITDGSNVAWMKADGTVVSFDCHGACHIAADFHAEGAGMCVALGAMHMGATAEQAARAACALNVYCGGEIQILSVRA